MQLMRNGYGLRSVVFVSPFLLTLIIFLGLTIGVVMAQDEDDKGMENEFANLLEIDPGNFSNSTQINNEWMPLRPGTQFIYEGFTAEEDEKIPHRIVFTVTDLTKVINGIRTVVVYDRDFSRGVMEESELTFFAQDNDGNVWHLGQYRETYDHLEFVGGRVWLVDLPEGAKAGIMMTAKPQLGKDSYSQGYAPFPFNWTDRAQVYKMGEKTKVPAGKYEDVLIIEEYNQEEPNAFQLKYYARGVGNVRVGWRGTDATQETLELTKVVELSPEDLAKIREEALMLEKRAYMYGKTLPAEQAIPVQKPMGTK
jgi:hypothetical protein